MRTGVFYGVGIGPGDPELMTLKALGRIRDSHALAVPYSSDKPGSQSTALAIVGKLINIDKKEILKLHFPMVKDKAALEASRDKAAEKIAALLSEGKDVAFITLGDPMLYSTFSYLMPVIKEKLPQAEIRSIPGITSFCASASCSLTALAESGEKVIIIPAAYDVSELKEKLKEFDTAVLMKVNRHMDKIIEAIESEGLSKSSVFISRASWPEEAVVTDLQSLKNKDLDYFSTLIIKKNGKEFLICLKDRRPYTS